MYFRVSANRIFRYAECAAAVSIYNILSFTYLLLNRSREYRGHVADIPGADVSRPRTRFTRTTPRFVNGLFGKEEGANGSPRKGLKLPIVVCRLMFHRVQPVIARDISQDSAARQRPVPLRGGANARSCRSRVRSLLVRSVYRRKTPSQVTNSHTAAMRN